MMDKKKYRGSILVLLGAYHEEIEAIVPIDVWRRAQLHVDTVSSTARRQIIGAHNIVTISDFNINDKPLLDQYDALFIPGGPGTQQLSENEHVRDIICTMYDAGKLIIAICAAPALILERLGILAGRKCTCYPQLASYIEQGQYVADQIVVKDGNVITSQGAGTAMDLALYVVDEILGAGEGAILAKTFCYPYYSY